MKITGAQIRAARAYLRWTIATLADHAGVGISTVQSIEQADGEPGIKAGVETTRAWRAGVREESLEKIAAALEKEGITFLPPDARHGSGLRGRIR